MTKFSVFHFLVLFDQSFLNLHVWGGGGRFVAYVVYQN